MLELIGVATNGRWKLQPNSEKLLTTLLRESEGKFVKGRFSRVGKNKSHKQCKTHFGLAIAMIREALIKKERTICGVPPNKEMVHEILLKSCGGVGELGQMKRLSEMTTTEAKQFFKNIQDWADSELDIYIPDPDPNWKQSPKPRG